jgi:hypothetical protein
VEWIGDEMQDSHKAILPTALIALLNCFSLTVVVIKLAVLYALVIIIVANTI